MKGSIAEIVSTTEPCGTYCVVVYSRKKENRLKADKKRSLILSPGKQ